MMSGYLHVSVLLCACLSQEVPAATSSDLSRLYETLFCNYSTVVRPKFNQSDITDISVEFFFIHINNLDMRTEILQSNGWFQVAWKDEFLKWNPEHYGGIRRILVPQKWVWRPDLMIANIVTGNRDIGTVNVNVDINSDGTVNWSPEFNTETTCEVDITLYPFDTQTCGVNIMSWTMLDDAINLVTRNSILNLSYSFSNGEFHISKTFAHKKMWKAVLYSGLHFHELQFGVYLQRRVTYYVMSLLLPVLMTSLLCITTFLVPIESGEKVTVAMTILLSFTVFLSVLDSYIPRTSQTISLLILYLALLMFISFLCVLVNIIVLFVYNRPPQKRIPHILLRLMTCFEKKTNPHRCSDLIPCEKTETEYELSSRSEVHGVQKCYRKNLFCKYENSHEVNYDSVSEASCPGVLGQSHGHKKENYWKSDEMNPYNVGCGLKTSCRQDVPPDSNPWHILAQILNNIFLILMACLLFFVVLIMTILFLV